MDALSNMVHSKTTPAGSRLSDGPSAPARIPATEAPAERRVGGDARGPRRRSGRRPGRRACFALAAALLLAAAFGVSQVGLPGIIATRLRSSLQSHATDVRVSVAASPAIELLFGHADHVSVSISQLRSSSSSGLESLLDRTAATDDLDATVARLYTHGLELDNVSLTKRGAQLAASATLTRVALDAALPVDPSLTVTSTGPQALSLAAQTTVFGHAISATAIVQARNGKLLLAPDAPILSQLSITLFSDPRVSVDALTVIAHGGAYTFSAQGRLT